MADRVVLVKGPPASGKPTLAAELTERLGWVVLSKEVLKETFGGLVWPRVSSARSGGLALDTVCALAEAVEGGVVLDALSLSISLSISLSLSVSLSTRDRTFFEAGVATMREPSVVGVWHDIPESWRPGFWEGAGPITENPIRVDTTVAVDVAGLAQVARATLEP